MSKNCVCVSDIGFPSEIPVSKRPKKGEEYTIIKMDKLNGHGGIMGVQLEEISLEGCAPYLYFAASRFAPITPDKELEAEVREEMFELA